MYMMYRNAICTVRNAEVTFGSLWQERETELAKPYHILHPSRKPGKFPFVEHRYTDVV
jgi:hypothetical protein